MKTNKEKKQAKDSLYFDDCALCQMMEESEKTGKVFTISQIKKGFKNMKLKGAIVGEDLST
ncbi:hypothetical protein HYU92_05385 [Candidatus Curtissbacteria bacterium]|nr:hypothetical protein [Candidatus Curtissbacteria bacterium]